MHGIVLKVLEKLVFYVLSIFKGATGMAPRDLPLLLTRHFIETSCVLWYQGHFLYSVPGIDVNTRID